MIRSKPFSGLILCLLTISATNANYVEVHFTAEITETIDSERQVGGIVTGSYRYDLELPRPVNNWGTGWTSETYESAYPTSIMIDGVQLIGSTPHSLVRTELHNFQTVETTNQTREVLSTRVSIVSRGFATPNRERQTNFHITLYYSEHEPGLTGLAKLENLNDLTEATIAVSSWTIDTGTQSNLLEYRGKIIQARSIEHIQKPEIVFLETPHSEISIHTYGKLERSNDLVHWEVEENRTLPLSIESSNAVFFRISEEYEEIAQP